MSRRTARSVIVAAGVGVATTSCNGRLVLNFVQDGGAYSTSSGQDAASAGALASTPCVAPASWLPVTPAVAMTTPPPHPDSECPFYEGAYQNFLVAMQPGASGDPAIFTYPMIDDAFTSASPHGTPNTATRAWLSRVSQAAYQGVLVDRNGHAIYYGIHLNQAFADFIRSNGLQTVAGIMAVAPTLTLPPGVVALETAWQDIDPQDFPGGVVPSPTDFASDPGDYSNYITAAVWIPHLRQDPTSHAFLVDLDHPALRKMALVAVDLEFTLPGHPEMIWATVQHVNTYERDPLSQAFADASVLGLPDTQPYSSGPDGGVGALPSPTDPENQFNVWPPDAEHRYLLYAPGALEAQSNLLPPATLVVLDEATQSISEPAPVNVFRVFGGSRSTGSAYSPGVVSLNESVASMWSSGPRDARQNYRLAGALWLDKPAFFGVGDGGLGLTFQNDDGTNPLVLGAEQVPPNVYPQVSEGVFCGTPLDGTNTSGDSPAANASNNSVPGCTTRRNQLDAGDPAIEQGFLTHTLGTDSPFSILGGDDRLSDPAIETLTQNGQFHDCMSCHNTSPSNADGVIVADPTCLVPNPNCATPIIPFAAGINVSRVFAEFVMREQPLDGGASD
jgi:hypothetical protein